MNTQTVFLDGKHVGVTGANGFLGTHICKKLLEKDAIIHAYIYPGTNTKNIEDYILDSDGDIKHIDITKPETLIGKFEDIEYLFQIAGTVAEWAYPIKKIFDINVYGVRNVHKYAKKAGVKRTVHTSSMTANGSCPEPYPAVASEDAPWDLHNTGPYSVSKYFGDQIAKNFNRNGIYETIRIRPHQILGWGDTGPSVPGQLVLQAITSGFPAYIDQVTQIVHVEDVAEAHIAAMERGTPGSVYNIASEKPIRIFEFLKYVCKIANVKPPMPIAIPKWILKILGITLENFANQVTHKPPLLTRGNANMFYKNLGTSIERAKKELGFKPRPWQEAVREAVRWFREGYEPVKRTYDR
ncbi:MAG: NAD-dependent epimerase/dehydratase family protein [Candidatus Helarchaeota archaeon]